MCARRSPDAARARPGCGALAPVRSSWWRGFAHTPVGKSAVHLRVRCRRYECRACSRSWPDDLSRVAPEGGKLTEAAAWWTVGSLVLDAMSVRSVAATLGCSWDCVNDAAPAKGAEHLTGDPARLDGVSAIGVDEHVWRHTPRGGRYVTVVVDLTPTLRVIWGACQKVIERYACGDRARGRGMMAELIDGINAKPSNAPRELLTLACTFKRRFHDIVAYFDHDFSGNGPIEAINGRLEHPRGIALGFTNITNYIT